MYKEDRGGPRLHMSRTPDQIIMQKEPGHRACLLGNLAIVRGALEAGVQFVSCFPGTPSSEIGDTFGRIAGAAGITFEYSVNEKISVETAFAASLTGARSLCSMKHLGLNSAGDPVSSLPYVGVEGGMVIVSAGDPSLHTSPNEQDHRHCSRFLYYPTFDPATPDDAFRMTRYAFELSERTRLPVLMRPTTRICHSGGVIEFGALPIARNEIRFTKNASRYVPIPANAKRMRIELSARVKHATALLDESPFFPLIRGGRRGVIAGGVAHTYVLQVIEDLGLHDAVTVQQIGAYPVPDRVLDDFLECVDSVLVVEELTPFIEEIVSLRAFQTGRTISVLGKHSGHFPEEFEYSPQMVEDALRDYLGLDRRETVTIEVEHLPDRPPVLCPGCPHRNSFYLARKAFGKRTVYCGDIGCYTLGYGEPLDVCDVLLCMGSSISQASGISRMIGKRTVAFIGDSTYFHSGMPAMANALQANDEITVVILDNYVTAMTGFQPSLTTGVSGDTSGESQSAKPSMSRISIEDSIRGLGVKNVRTVDPLDTETALAALRQAKDGKGVNVVICASPCVVDPRQRATAAASTPLEIDAAVCDSCSACVRLLGCPAILVIENEYRIDRNLCTGCNLCAEVCGRDAIHPIVEELNEDVPTARERLRT